MQPMLQQSSSDFGKFGDGVRSAIANFLDSGEYGDLGAGQRLKFLSEALIAIAADSAWQDDLHTRISARLFGDDTIARLISNPLTLSSYAIPLSFAARNDETVAALQQVFVKFHRAGVLAMPNYPHYRNLELDFAALRIGGTSFFVDPFRRTCRAAPWLVRDHVYGLTHIHFYNSDFGRRVVRYSGPAAEMWEVMIALAQLRGDDDLMLELMICYATTEGAKAETIALYDRIADERIGKFGSILDCDHTFRRGYHLCFVAWLYEAARRNSLDLLPRSDSPHEADEGSQGESLRRVFTPLVDGDPFAFLSAYADHCRTYGPNPAIEPNLALFGEIMSIASSRDRPQANAA